MGAGTLRIHGALVSIYGVGLLLRGPSGVGKSECALELVRRGHCLVADDVVEVRQEEMNDRLLGSCPERLAGRLEVQDVGIIDVVRLFGEKAVEGERWIDAVVELLPPRPDNTRQRPVTTPEPVQLGEVSLPCFITQATCATTIANRLEVIARTLRRKEAVDG